MDKKRSPTIDNLAEILNDASIDRILAIDSGWKIIAWNSSSERSSGIARGELLGRHLLEAFPAIADDAELLDAFRNAMAGTTTFLPAKAGRFHRHFFENHFIPLNDGGTTNLGVMNIMHDAAPRVKAELELEKLNNELKEKFRQLEEAGTELAMFTTITGNDLKEPLKKIYTALELIMINDGRKLSDSSKAAMRRMQTSLNRINFLLDDILVMATANNQVKEFTQNDTGRLLREVIRNLPRKIIDKKPEFQIGELPCIVGSTPMLHYLFNNIIDNAIKFQPENQTPQITVTGEKIRRKAEQTEGAMDWVKISIADNGIGFNQEDASRIFNLFEKLDGPHKFAGSGIGLALCKKIMDAHRGFIEVYSQPDQGSRFDCYFPDMKHSI